MEKEIKSGGEVLSDFFENISSLKDVNEKVIEILSRLFKDDKLTKTNLINELETLREIKND